MDVTSVVPKAGFVVAATMVLALVAASAAAAAPSTLTYEGSATPRTITYSDPSGNVDRVVVEMDEDEGQNPAFGFLPDGGDPFVTGSGCGDNGDVLFCPADAELLVFRLQAGDDSVKLGSPELTGANARPSDVEGGPGDDHFEGGALADDFSGGSGDDRMVGLTNGDRFLGRDGTDTLDLGAGGPWTVTLDGVPDDGAGSGGNANVGVDVEVVLGSAGGDDFTGGAGAQTLRGAGGGDILEGGAGSDQLAGEAGDDMILAQDGAVDAITCGPGADSVFADWNDTVAADCETVTRAARDDDGDGSPSGVDCDDSNPDVKPGGGDVPGNGLDEDCAGGDAVVDADGDGAAAAADCDDANAARFPGAAEVPANGVDEDCDGRDGTFPTVAATIASGWKVFGSHTRLTSLEVKGAPAGAKVRVTCKGKRKGCPFERRTATVGAKGRVALTKRFKRAKLKPGAVIEVRVSAEGAVAKVLRIRIRSRKAPKRVTLCLAPGASKPAACG